MSDTSNETLNNAMDAVALADVFNPNWNPAAKQAFHDLNPEQQQQSKLYFGCFLFLNRYNILFNAMRNKMHSLVTISLPTVSCAENHYADLSNVQMTLDQFKNDFDELRKALVGRLNVDLAASEDSGGRMITKLPTTFWVNGGTPKELFENMPHKRKVALTKIGTYLNDIYYSFLACAQDFLDNVDITHRNGVFGVATEAFDEWFQETNNNPPAEIVEQFIAETADLSNP